MSDLSLIDTIVIVMLENRSFDHMLGHMSLPQYGNRVDVDGLTEPLRKPEYENLAQGHPYYPFALRDGELSSDLPHERNEVFDQIALSEVTGRYTMSGFVESYFAKTQVNRPLQPDPMGFLTPADLPITRFLADNFAVCDRWFAPLPTSTQPNRLMALAGTSRIEITKGLFPPIDDLVIDWLNKCSPPVPWRVYHCGISFFALLGRVEIFGPNFRPVDRLGPDVAHEKDDDFPKVIFIEPSYADAPHIGYDIPNDNHPPLAVAPGELLLKQVYEALTSNVDRWKRTLLIVTYDEHGGFFDHVPPIPIEFRPAPDAIFKNKFLSTGVRVPGLIVSPLVSAGSVFKGLLDHTSILQLIAEKFASSPDNYSVPVSSRRSAGIRSVSEVLNLAAPRDQIPIAPEGPASTVVQFSPKVMNSVMEKAFRDAAIDMVKNHPRETAQTYPEVSHWVLANGGRS